jgi:hypothetical protein
MLHGIDHVVIVVIADLLGVCAAVEPVDLALPA